jgi:hypothetical protein
LNIERLLHPIDNDEGQEAAGGKANYDESEDEEDVDLGSAPPSSSAVVPLDADDDIDLCSDELAKILADGPIRQMKQSRVTKRAAVVKDEVDGEVFVNDWVS